ncbi:MAG: hypothetical protein JXR89_04330 [Deltaproteobacteria bacterium]|nr:hypothetical protein [Deltaproteobacteria bacterium]
MQVAVEIDAVISHRHGKKLEVLQPSPLERYLMAAQKVVLPICCHPRANVNPVNSVAYKFSLAWE